MTDQDKELRRLAQAATPGPWHFWHGRIATDIDMDGGVIIAERPKHSGGKYQTKVDANFAFVAAANPATIRSLLDRLEAAERDAARLHGIRTLCGFVENGSDTVVKIFQDDATRDWVVKWGKQEAHSGSFGTAIDAAMKKENES